MSYDEMFESISDSSRANTSKLFEQLTLEQQTDVSNFISYLKSDTTMTQNSINSYKSYIMKSMLDPTNLDRNQRSAVKKFRSWFDQK